MTDRYSPCLAGDGIDPNILGEIAAKHGFDLCAVDQSAQKGGVLLMGEVDAERLTADMNMPFVAYIEYADGLTNFSETCQRTTKKGGLYVALSTSTAFFIELAGIFCRELKKRAAWPEEKMDDIELAVHEALANALIHGNLETGSELRQSTDKFLIYCQTLSSRLLDPAFAQRRVEVAATWDTNTLEIIIGDEGSGYCPKKINSVINGEAKSGRGIAIIQSLTDHVYVDENGRNFTMLFKK